MKDTPPSIQDWKNLYNVAVEFKKFECWNWMWDSDVFGVQNPENGEIGYCCIMGNLGEVFALAVYLGAEGLDGYLKMRSGIINPGDIGALHIHKCLMASFEDRELLQKQDRKVIKKLGLKFRGRNAWPVFRSFRPGYHPWYLTADEARYLTLVLQQAAEVALRFKKDPEMLNPPREDHYFVRVPKKGGEGLRWRDEWLEPPPPEKAEIVPDPMDRARLERIRKTVRRHGVWEVDFFYSPVVVNEGGRPYYPYAFLWVDHYSGFVYYIHLTEPWKYGREFSKQFLDLIEKIKLMPGEVLVRKEEAFKLLEPITSRFGIELRLVKRLMEIEEARTDLFEFFG